MFLNWCFLLKLFYYYYDSIFIWILKFKQKILYISIYLKVYKMNIILSWKAQLKRVFLPSDSKEE